MRWVAVDHSGYLIASLTTLLPGGALRRTMGRYESQTFSLVVDSKTDPAWLAATTPYAGALIGYEGDPGQERIQWGGIVTRRKRTLGNIVELTAATPDAYLDRRYTGDFSKTDRDQNLIVSDLVAIAAGGDPRVAGSVGYPFTVEVVGAPGILRTRNYLDTQDKTIYSALQELGNVEGGPQWTTSWRWTHGPERVFPVVQTGTRVGAARAAAAASPVTFTPRMMIEGSLEEDYAAGRGANLTTAVSTSFDGARPQQSAGVLQPNRPLVEQRFTPSTDITEAATLLGHARARLRLVRDGSVVYAVKLARAGSPTLGGDWDLGDDIDIELNGPTFTAPAVFTAQVIGVEMDDESITPYFATIDEGA